MYFMLEEKVLKSKRKVRILVGLLETPPALTPVREVIKAPSSL
jgi:hypothetical protein